jgi:hypothetical protein
MDCIHSHKVRGRLPRTGWRTARTGDGNGIRLTNSGAPSATDYIDQRRVFIRKLKLIHISCFIATTNAATLAKNILPKNRKSLATDKARGFRNLSMHFVLKTVWLCQRFSTDWSWVVSVAFPYAITAVHSKVGLHF